MVASVARVLRNVNGVYQSTCNCTFPGSRTTVAETGGEIVGSERNGVSPC